MLLSFGIPAHNEEALIAATIRSIHHSATNAGVDYEIVVAADACPDGRREPAR